MQKQIKVTFDKNVYEFVINPEKEAPMTLQQREAFRAIHYLIIDKRILPFVSETILTYETIGRKNRFKVLTHDKPIIVTSNGSQISVSSNPKIHPGNHSIDNLYLKKAIDMGFKILPGRRFGKLINPAIESEWYHYTNEDYLITSERFGTVIKEIESFGGGYKQYSNLITTKENEHLSPYDRLKLYKGSEKKLSAAIAEWSDGDSIALHIVHGLDYFCTNDEGKNAGANSALSKKIYERLNLKFKFQKKSPEELMACFFEI